HRAAGRRARCRTGVLHRGAQSAGGRLRAGRPVHGDADDLRDGLRGTDLMNFLVTGMEVLVSALLAVLPIVAVVLFFQFAAIRRPLPNPRRAILGLIYVVVGLVILLEGLELSLFPLGAMMADQLT